jgi:hypothetical protein
MIPHDDNPITPKVGTMVRTDRETLLVTLLTTLPKDVPVASIVQESGSMKHYSSIRQVADQKFFGAFMELQMPSLTTFKIGPIGVEEVIDVSLQLDSEQDRSILSLQSLAPLVRKPDPDVLANEPGAHTIMPVTPEEILVCDQGRLVIELRREAHRREEFEQLLKDVRKAKGELTKLTRVMDCSGVFLDCIGKLENIGIGGLDEYRG